MTQGSNPIFANGKLNIFVYATKSGNVFKYSIPRLAYTYETFIQPRTPENTKILQLAKIDKAIETLFEMRKAVVSFYEKESQQELF